ncbi:MAG: MgtC/SapB family protein [Syntrophomonas sp.]|uniref:MgtC/SapB family protein n=1 Tax=Syntrophomonas sp. TaxID=2053627 RepID=UPI002632C208|nr:MgtC/SapB family protein [Syntrophomonas sp.]MDD2510556.1 MgtC/SapB family protein [Syntrophomonas sp.]MDD3878837.1 MgtC/SapB family protein [Syntrophomonas sp.]MDD4626679.1 MgtC/SapB family protein [Syntrophomonas sp.]
MEIWVGRIVLAAIMGFILGVSTDRSISTTRTYTITCMVAALLTIVSNEFYKNLTFPWYSDPGRLSAQIISAIGFIGTGLIWMAEDKQSSGLSLAASLWITAILGILIGAGLQQAMILATFLVIIVFWFSDSLIRYKNYLWKIFMGKDKIKKGE